MQEAHASGRLKPHGNLTRVDFLITFLACAHLRGTERYSDPLLADTSTSYLTLPYLTLGTLLPLHITMSSKELSHSIIPVVEPASWSICQVCESTPALPIRTWLAQAKS